ncbi:hypothetical protein HD554DRAFT_2140100 [Boletus coccyginus]|nr:hypothetical protein HD554DRAFT_2140100 [Boletus coccyginus]
MDRYPQLYASVKHECVFSKTAPLWTDAVFYLTLLLVPAICLTRDLAWKYFKRTYNPRSYHVAQEVQKYNVLNYLPKQAQFQKAIKKVRVVQRMKRNPGLAFSQTEGGAAGDAGGVGSQRGIDSDCVPPFSFFVDVDVLILRYDLVDSGTNSTWLRKLTTLIKE